MGEFTLLLDSIWNLLDDAAVPAPSHRNSTMTDWANRIKKAKELIAGGLEVAVQHENAVIEAKVQRRQYVALTEYVMNLSDAQKKCPCDSTGGDA